MTWRFTLNFMLGKINFKLFLNLNLFLIYSLYCFCFGLDMPLYIFVSYMNFKIWIFFRNMTVVKYVSEMMRQAGIGGKITSPKDRKFYGDWWIHPLLFQATDLFILALSCREKKVFFLGRSHVILQCHQIRCCNKE